MERVVEFLRAHVFGGERTELLRKKLEATDPEADAERDESQEIRGLVDDLELRSRRQMANLEREDPDGEAAEEIRSRLRELARTKAQNQRELEAAERALAGRDRGGEDVGGSITKRERDAQRLVNLASYAGLALPLLAFIAALYWATWVLWIRIAFSAVVGLVILTILVSVSLASSTNQAPGIVRQDHFKDAITRSGGDLSPGDGMLDEMSYEFSGEKPRRSEHPIVWGGYRSDVATCAPL